MHGAIPPKASCVGHKAPRCDLADCPQRYGLAGEDLRILVRTFSHEPVIRKLSLMLSTIRAKSGQGAGSEGRHAEVMKGSLT